MPEFKLTPYNCAACGYWTATQISRTEIGWTLQCTHCGGKLHQRGTSRAFHLFLQAVARFEQQVPEHCPDFALLTVRGAYLKFPPSH